MPTLARLLLVCASLLFGPLVVMADELPKDLRHIKTLAPEQAQALVAQRQGSECLAVEGLTALDTDTAKALAEFKGEQIRLDGLATLEGDTAKALAKFKGENLLLNGLTTLDADSAMALAEFKGVGLYVKGLTRDADTAKALAGSAEASCCDLNLTR
jgi:hypothetical protein